MPADVCTKYPPKLQCPYTATDDEKSAVKYITRNDERDCPLTKENFEQLKDCGAYVSVHGSQWSLATDGKQHPNTVLHDVMTTRN